LRYPHIVGYGGYCFFYGGDIQWCECNIWCDIYFGNRFGGMYLCYVSVKYGVMIGLLCLGQVRMRDGGLIEPVLRTCYNETSRQTQIM